MASRVSTGRETGRSRRRSRRSITIEHARASTAKARSLPLVVTTRAVHPWQSAARTPDEKGTGVPAGVAAAPV